MEITLEQMAEELTKHKEYRIYCHLEPDGDAVGTAYALGLALRSHGAKCEVFCGSEPDKKLYREIINKYTWDITKDPVTLTVDTPSVARLGDHSDVKIDLCIDHHENNTIAARLKYVEPTASSCAEVVYKMLSVMGIKITAEIADLLFIGLITDTNCFRSAGVTADSFVCAAGLAECGADTVGITKHIYMTKTAGMIEFDKSFGSGITYSCGGKLVCVVITLADQKKIGDDFNEIFDVKSRVQQIEGVSAGVTILEKKPGIFKASVHTDGTVDAAAICRELGGGGHADRAGTGAIEGTPETVRDKIISVCEKYIRH